MNTQLRQKNYLKLFLILGIIYNQYVLGLSTYWQVRGQGISMN